MTVTSDHNITILCYSFVHDSSFYTDIYICEFEGINGYRLFTGDMRSHHSGCFCYGGKSYIYAIMVVVFFFGQNVCTCKCVCVCVCVCPCVCVHVCVCVCVCPCVCTCRSGCSFGYKFVWMCCGTAGEGPPLLSYHLLLFWHLSLHNICM